MGNNEPDSSRLVAALVLAAAFFTAGCKSPHVAVTVENRTGAEVRLLEVDYPSASFGADSLAPGTTMHYSIAVTADGPMKVQYTMPNNAIAQQSGPVVKDAQAGTLTIVLTPNGHAEFQPNLQAK